MPTFNAVSFWDKTALIGEEAAKAKVGSWNLYPAIARSGDINDDDIANSLFTQNTRVFLQLFIRYTCFVPITNKADARPLTIWYGYTASIDPDFIPVATFLIL